MKPTVFVTGHRGLFGSSLLRIYRDRFDVVTFDGDIGDHATLAAWGADKHVDAVIHAAAMTDINLCETERERCFRSNVTGTRNIRDLAKAKGAKLIYISTSAVFPGDTGNYHEQDLPYPKNYYNITKYLGEIVASEYEGATVIRMVLLGIHPEGSRGRSLIEFFIDSARANRDLKLFTDLKLNALSTWTTAEILAQMIERKLSPAMLHLGSSDVVSKAEIGRMVLGYFPDYSGKITESTSDELSAVAHRPKAMWLNIDEAEKLLGMKMPTMKEEIEKIYENDKNR